VPQACDLQDLGLPRPSLFLVADTVDDLAKAIDANDICAFGETPVARLFLPPRVRRAYSDRPRPCGCCVAHRPSLDARLAGKRRQKSGRKKARARISRRRRYRLDESACSDNNSNVPSKTMLVEIHVKTKVSIAFCKNAKTAFRTSSAAPQPSPRLSEISFPDARIIRTLARSPFVMNHKSSNQQLPAQALHDAPQTSHAYRIAFKAATHQHQSPIFHDRPNSAIEKRMGTKIRLQPLFVPGSCLTILPGVLSLDTRSNLNLLAREVKCIGTSGRHQHLSE
jgi:hypothetical protein